VSREREDQRPDEATLKRIDEVCDRFEKAWQAGQRPRLEAFLDAVEEAEQTALLRELLLLDLHYRAEAGEQPDAKDYHRLRGYEELVEELFSAVPPAAAEGGGSTSWPETRDEAWIPPAPNVAPGAEWPALAGRYRVAGKIAEGGMGVVVRAYDPELNRPLAVKIVKKAFAGRVEMERRFLEEAQVTGQLQHPGVPPIHDIGRLEDGRPFFAMKLIKGRTLAELLAQRNSPSEDLPRWLAVFEQVCQAVAYAHSKRVIHRDLKPANVMVGAFGEVQVMDWGLAKVLTGPLEAAPAMVEVSGIETTRTSKPEEWTRPDTLLGTLPYMAPEQARAEIDRVDERADVFSLGAILCVILTGQPPYRGPDFRRQAKQADLADAFTRLESCGAEVELVRLARACLAAEPSERPRNAGAVTEAVRRYQQSVAERLRQAELERAQAQVQAREERKRRRLAVVLTAAVLALLVAGAAGGLYWREQQTAARARRLQADEKAREALESAGRLLTDGWETQDLVRLTQAMAEAGRAVDITLSGSASPDVRQEAEDFRRDVAARLNRAMKNRGLLDALLDVSGPRETNTYKPDASGRLVLDEPSADQQYAAAFRKWWDLDLDKAPESEVMRRLQQEPELVVDDLIAALDAWMLERRRKNHPAGEWRRLVRLAERLDRNGQRRQLRALLVGGLPPRAEDVAGLVGAWPAWPAVWQLRGGNPWGRLHALSAGVDPAKASVLTVVLLAETSSGLGDAAGAERMLRAALVARPSQVVFLNALGGLLERQGRLAGAIECYRTIRAVHPGLGITLSRAFRNAGLAAEGEAVLRDLSAKQPRNPEIWFYLGCTLHEQKKWSQTEAACRNAIALQPDHIEAHFKLGDALAAQQKLTEAKAVYRKAIEINPKLPHGPSALAQVLIQQSRFAEAQTTIQRWLDLFPPGQAPRTVMPQQLAVVYLGLGTAMYRQNKLAAAEAAYGKAIELKPDFPEAYHNLGAVLGNQKKLVAAEAAFRKAIAFHSDYPGAYHGLGNALVRQNKLAEAEVAFRKAIALQPDFSEAYVSLGAAFFNQKNVGEAVAAFRKAIELKANYPEAYNNLGAAFEEQKKFAEAVAAYHKAIQLKPDYPLAYKNLGSALAAQQKPAEAEAAYRMAIDLKLDDPEAYTNLGLALAKQKKLAEAVAAYRKAIERKPDYHAAYANLGNALRAQKKLGEAEAATRKAIELRGDSPNLYYNLGLILSDQKKPVAAEAAYRKAIALQPDFAEAYTGLGNALHDQKKLAAAEAAHRKAVALKPNLAGAYNNLGSALYDQKKLVAAEAAFRKAIDLQPDLALAHNNLGNALRDQKKLAAAEAAYRKAIALQPDFAGAYTGLGIILSYRKKFVEAEAAYRKAIALQPDYSVAYMNLGGTLAAQGKPAKAEAIIRKAIALKPDSAEAYYNLGVILYNQKKLAPAEAACRKAIALQPDYPRAYVGLGNALLQQQKLAAAEAAFRKAIDLKPDYRSAYMDLGSALAAQEKPAPAEAAFRKAIALKPDEPMAHYNLGITLYEQQKLAAAADAYRKAIALKPDFAKAYHNLGDTLHSQQKPAEAAAALRKAIELDPTLAKTHGLLGLVLLEQGQFAEARQCTHRGLTLLPAGHPLRLDVSRQLQHCERLIALEKRLVAVLKGEAKPKDAAERLDLAWLCRQPYQRQYSAATRFYAAAFAAQPKFADDLRHRRRYNAACAAALAGTDRDKDPTKLNAKEQARLRQQALDWLKADLAAWAKLADGPAAQHPAVRQVLRHWCADADLAGVRDKSALDKLPAGERDAWRKLWADVDGLLKRVSEKK
jgi:superkiller protein 3